MVTVTCVAVVTRDLGLPPAGTRRLSLLTGAAGAVGTATFFLATHHGLLAITAVITSLYPAVTILLARVLLGERLTPLRIAGLGLAAASVALIAVGGPAEPAIALAHGDELARVILRSLRGMVRGPDARAG